MTNIKSFNPNLVSIGNISYKNTDAVVYNIKYIMMGSINNQNIDSENPLCLSFSDVDPYIIEENNVNKYLIIYRKLWTEIRNKIKTTNSSW